MAELKKVKEAVWEMEKTGNMNVPVRVFANDALIEQIKRDRTIQQAQNVAKLPGILRYSYVMPDGHEGYGFPIGGVAAFDSEEGIISPGGVGYDINCGVRLIATPLTYDDVKPKLKQLVNGLFKNCPSGVGSKGKLRLNPGELDQLVTDGVRWAVNKGYGNEDDIQKCEEYGRMEGANPDYLSDLAKKRGGPQCGTLGAGNHFIEVQRISEVPNPEVAKKFGLFKDQVCVMIHCGSRGFGHQVCDDYLRKFMQYIQRNNIQLPDRELVYAPLKSREAQEYLGAFRCAVNFALANRHMLAYWAKLTFDEVFGKGTSEKIHLVYDVCHNIAKFEEHEIDGKRVNVCIHRKGATRAFGPGRKEIPQVYRDIGQPVFIPGSMGTASYVLVGQKSSEQESFGSSCHGSGRVMSRHAAIKKHQGVDLKKLMESKGFTVQATTNELLAEEAPDAYKNVDDVVKSVAQAGISGIVARLVPMGVAKG